MVGVVSDDCVDVSLGDRVRLTAPMLNPGHPIIPDEHMPAGSEGTVDWLGHCGQIGVRWDGGRRLMLLIGVDQFEVIR